MVRAIPPISMKKEIMTQEEYNEEIDDILEENISLEEKLAKALERADEIKLTPHIKYKKRRIKLL